MSLELDARRRAMLLEMGIRVWAPERADAQAQPDAATSIVAAVVPVSPPPKPASVVARPDLSPAADDAARPAAPLPARPATQAALAAATLPPDERAAAIARMDWSALQSSVADCRACGLCESRRQTVFGTGDRSAPVDWLIVGEAPGEREDSLGEPFVGPAGKLLDNMLHALGLSRQPQAPAEPGQRVFITNVLKCRPPGNRNPQPAELAQCAPYLARQIELLAPRLILALGRFAAQALLHETVPDVHAQPLGKLRGRPHRFQGIPLVVSYHPAYLLRNPVDKAKSWADLVLARGLLQGRSD